MGFLFYSLKWRRIHSTFGKLILTRRQVARKFKHCGRLLACVNYVIPKNSVHVAQFGVVADFNTSIENFCYRNKKKMLLSEANHP